MTRNRNLLIIMIMTGLLLLGAASEARATSITIANPSFESPVLADGAYLAGFVDGWTFPSSTGIINPTTAQAIPTDGVNVAFNNGNAIFEQITSTLLTANTVYTLTVDVGRRGGTGTAIGTLILTYDNKSANGTGPGGGPFLAYNPITVTGATSEWVTGTVSFTPLTGDPLLGQNIAIRLENGNGGATQVLFDNVRLDATPAGSTVPEPATMLLLGLGLVGLAGVRRKMHK